MFSQFAVAMQRLARETGMTGCKGPVGSCVDETEILQFAKYIYKLRMN